MSEDLRPCPFCGGDDVKHALPGDDHEFIICNDCGADMDRVNCQDDPVPAWNRRAGQQGEARPAPTAPNLACPSVQARLAEQWGYTREEDGERDTLRALLREARGVIGTLLKYANVEPCADEISMLTRIDAALADGGAK